MSNSDNPFSAPTTVAEPVLKKSPVPKRGVAHIVRRAKLPSQGSPAPALNGSTNSDSAKGGKAHVISRNAPTHLADDSIDQLITSPALKTPQKPEEPIPEARGKKAAALNPQSTVRGGGPLGTGSIDELTVEEGRPVPPQALVDLADKIDPEVAPPEDPNRGFLAVRSGADLGRRIGLLEGRTTIGRGLDCDIVLTDPTISRQHAYVERRENVYVVCDLKSGNGTFVNERERQDEVLIVNGDTFRIGSSVICFEGPEAQNEASSTTNWAPPAVGGKKKGRGRRNAGDEESTVAGKVLPVQSPPTHLDEPDDPDDPVTQAPTGIVDSVQVASPPPKRSKRKKTVPPPIPEDKKSVQDAALAALSSIVNTPTPEILAVNQTGLGELPNQTVPPTPSPAILYPIGAPNPNPYPSAPPPMNLSQPAPAPRQASIPMGHGAPPPAYPMNSGPPPMQMRHASQAPLPMGQGLPPLPMGAYPHPSGAQLQRPMLAGAAPEMMRPGYGASSPAPRENGKLLIGFISVTLVLVVVGLLATVIGQMEEGKKDGEKRAGNAVGADAGAMAAKTTDSPDEQPVKYDPVEGDPTKGDPTKGDSTEGDPAKGDSTEGDPAKSDPAKSDSTKSDSTKSDPAKSDPTKNPGKEPLQLADLTAGKTTLVISAWGTDENFLSSITELRPTVEPIEVSNDDPPETGDPGSTGTDPDSTTTNDPPDDDPDKNEPKNTRVRTPKNARVRTPKNVRVRTPKVERNDNDSSKDVSAAARLAQDQAKTMYKNRQFLLASKRLVKAADNLPDDASEAGKLYDLADGYKDVGELFARAEKKDDQNNPGGALKDYKLALGKDKKVAGGALATLLRLRIRQIAPKAAASYMTSRNYSAAKEAAGDAKRYDNGEAVARIYDSLEGKASKLIKKALRAKKDGDSDKAKELLKEALEMAPRKSEPESRAKSELKRL